MSEPVWLDRLIVDSIHYEQLLEHGGQAGVRDENVLESALSRPRNKWAYEPESDIAALAAAYGYGLARNHGYLDGNKRVAFMASPDRARRGSTFSSSRYQVAVHLLLVVEGEEDPGVARHGDGGRPIRSEAQPVQRNERRTVVVSVSSETLMNHRSNQPLLVPATKGLGAAVRR